MHQVHFPIIQGGCKQPPGTTNVSSHLVPNIHIWRFFGSMVRSGLRQRRAREANGSPLCNPSLFNRGNASQNLIIEYGTCFTSSALTTDVLWTTRCAKKLRSQSPAISCCLGVCCAKMEACHWTGWHRFNGWES